MFPSLKAIFGGACLLAVALSFQLQAAVPGESYLNLQVADGGLGGEWKVAVLDLDTALQLDANGDDRISWLEIEPRQGDIEAYLRAGLHLPMPAGERAISFEKLLYGTQGGADFILAKLAVEPADSIRELDIDYTLFSALNPQHRCVVEITWPEGGKHKATLFAAGGVQHFAAETATRDGFLQFLRSGIWHIWIGYDHILFLIALLIPAVFQRTATGREPASSLGPALARVATIVTAFTITHSITLTCAMLEWIQLPSRLVESAIAASVLIAALHNLLPTTAGARGVWLALAFGLLHGFGFAGVLAEVDRGGAQLWSVLLGFNLGVEVGQLAIVAVFFPLAYSLRKTRFYRLGVLYCGSVAVAVCALIWLVQRAS